jgi:nucleolysin TIA-1/TIAR
MSPADDPAFAAKSLIVSNLDHRITEQYLLSVFKEHGMVTFCKLFFTESGGNMATRQGLVEFADTNSALRALSTVHGQRHFDMELQVSWTPSIGGAQADEDDSKKGRQLFVGDLSPEVTEQMLATAFTSYGALTEARIMWDTNTGRSRGFGFVTFAEVLPAENAMREMSGKWIGNRQIRVNWANPKVPLGAPKSPTSNTILLAQPNVAGLETVLMQAPYHNTTVYIGNLPFHFPQEQLVMFFQPFGTVEEIRFQADRGFAFIRMNSHEAAAISIVNINGAVVNGRQIKCSWGRDRSDSMSMWSPIQGNAMLPATAMTYPPAGYSMAGFSPTATSPPMVSAVLNPYSSLPSSPPIDLYSYSMDGSFSMPAQSPQQQQHHLFGNFMNTSPVESMNYPNLYNNYSSQMMPPYQPHQNSFGSSYSTVQPSANPMMMYGTQQPPTASTEFAHLNTAAMVNTVNASRVHGS